MKYNFEYQDFQPNNICNVGAAIIGGGVLSAGASIYGSSQASKAQQAAAAQAAATSMAMYNQTRSDLAPYRQIGEDAYGDLKERLPFLTSPIEISKANLINTPGYKFNLSQGLKATQNAAAARGLGVSGAALKGAANFATGLADNTYEKQFNYENINRTNAYNRLKALIDTGQSAAAGTGAAGTNAANTTASAIMAGGNAAAAGYNGIGTGVGNLGSSLGTYAMYKGLFGNGFGGGGGGPIYVGNGSQSSMGGGYGGAFAEGGNPPVGVPSLVGEQGPEKFAPSSGGPPITVGASGPEMITPKIPGTVIPNPGTMPLSTTNPVVPGSQTGLPITGANPFGMINNIMPGALDKIQSLAGGAFGVSPDMFKQAMGTAGSYFDRFNPGGAGAGGPGNHMTTGNPIQPPNALPIAPTHNPFEAAQNYANKFKSGIDGYNYYKRMGGGGYTGRRRYTTNAMIPMGA